MNAIADRLAVVRERIANAASRAGRSPGEITLVAISKTFPTSAIAEAVATGISDIGENKAQEFTEKVDALADLPTVVWHFVGHLQRNKAKLVVGRADLIHSLDSERLATKIGSTASEAGVVQDCLIQVNVSGEASKFGIEPAELPRMVELAAGIEGIEIRGLMTLAEPSPDLAVIRAQFRRLKDLHDGLPKLGLERAEILSMGMSSDFEIAIEEGATHVRIGSAIFGPR